MNIFRTFTEAKNGERGLFDYFYNINENKKSIIVTDVRFFVEQNNKLTQMPLTISDKTGLTQALFTSIGHQQLISTLIH